eukprot:GFUD01022523.1.p1 GENE.GFUD01022523.1~~GFUD01022523.1.p1  ORF type:complete len:241 (+),score=52.01 GFUD01022523.1:275-997(+)
MFSHLMGHRHRQHFEEEIYTNDSSRVMDLSQGDLLKYARTHNENGDDARNRIRTWRSDEEYPWAPGKALVREGTGMPLDGARENWGQNQYYGQGSQGSIKPVVVGRVFADDKHKGGGLPSVERLRVPKNEEDAMKMIQLGEKMLAMGFEFCGSRLNHNEKRLGTCLTAIVSKIMVKRGMRANGHQSPPLKRRQQDSNGVHKRSRDRNSRSPSPHPVKRTRARRTTGAKGCHFPARFLQDY